MLDSIKQFDRKTREGILAGLAIELGNPFSEGRGLGDIVPHQDLFPRILEEIRSTLNLNNPNIPNDLARARVFEYLGKEIRQLALDSSHIAEARKRLGSKGLLASRAYAVSFLKAFTDLSEPLGLTPKEVISVVATPDLVEHLFPGRSDQDDRNAVSLFAKTYVHGSDPYSILVDGNRQGTEISVRCALRIFHSDVDVTSVRSPLELLRAFIDRFGHEFTVAQKASKFILYEKFPITSNISPQKLIEFRQEDGKSFDTFVTFRKTEDNILEVGIAYVINVSEYAASLLRHGIRVTRRDVRIPQP